MWWPCNGSGNSLVQLGAYGTGAAGALGPAPVTLTAGFTQPGSPGFSGGTTPFVQPSLSSTSGFKVGQLWLVGNRPVGANGKPSGGPANIYYVSSNSPVTFVSMGGAMSAPTGAASTFTNPGGAVGANGTPVTPVLDLLNYGNSQTTPLVDFGARGPYDWATAFNGSTFASGISNFSVGGGGGPDFAGLTKFSYHALVKPRNRNTGGSQPVFGFTANASWTSPFTDISLWVVSGSNGPTFGAFTAQSWISGGSGWSYADTSHGVVDLMEWNLLSVVFDLTAPSIALYKNGVACPLSSSSTAVLTTGSLSLASNGFFFIGNADSGDATDLAVGGVWFRDTADSAASVKAMASSIFALSIQ